MSPYNTIAFMGFLLGAVLHSTLLFFTVKRREKGEKEYLLLGLVSCSGLWHIGNFLELFFLLLFGETIPILAHMCRTAAYLGLAFLPSFLLQTYFSFIHWTDKEARRIHRIYPPLIFLPPFVFLWFARGAFPPESSSVFLFSSNLMRAFVLWFIFCLLGSTLLSLRLSVREIGANQTLHKMIARALAVIALLMSFVYLLGRVRIPSVGNYLHLLVALSSIVPAFILGYFVYRYSFNRIVIKPGILYSSLTGIVLAVYLLGIRRLIGYLDRYPEINSSLVEAVLLVALVFLFQPIKNRLQRIINTLFFKERYEYQRLMRELSQTVNSILDLDHLLDSVVNAVAINLKVQAASIVLLNWKDGDFDISHIIDSGGLPGLPRRSPAFGQKDKMGPETKRIISWLERERRYLDIGEVHERDLSDALRSCGIKLCLPIFREEGLIGLFNLGEKKEEVPFSSEERELLRTLCNQLALAIENARLVQRRLEIERRTYQAEKLSSLGQLVASVAHEVKNPLSSIRAIAQVMREDLKDDFPKAEDLSVIVGEIDRLNGVVDRLLKFARPAGDKLHQVDLQEILDNLVLVLRHEVERRNVEVEVELEDSHLILGDVEGLKEIFFNLLLNGIQAMEDGGRLKVWARSDDPWVEVAISDTGPGIPEESLAKIFEPFYSTKSVGTGLGLTIVKNNVERLGGRIEVESQRGSGTTFKLLLPTVERQQKTL